MQTQRQTVEIYARIYYPKHLMRSTDFLQAYPRDLTPDQVNRSSGVVIPEVEMAQLYGYSFGHIAYDALAGNIAGLPERFAQLKAFESKVDFFQVEEAILHAPGGWDYRNEINFYGLNQSMGEMWEPLVNGQWRSEGARTHAVHSTMNGLAMTGLAYYSLRERFLRTFPDPNDPMLIKELLTLPFYRRLAGAVQEFDGTIVVLDWAKTQPGVTVVPAPPQFEHSTSGANADLLVVHTGEQRAVGVQVKTTVDERTHRKYDPERIVIVGTEDLGNVRVLAGKGRQAEQRAPWPGVVAASRVEAMQTKVRPGTRPDRLQGMMDRKMFARDMLRGHKVDYREAARDIGARILAKL
jgi:hypothetical protein